MKNISYNMQLTLEEHFKDLGDIYPDVGELYSLWILIKKDLTEKLFSTKRVFPHYSTHDANHSKSIIKNIEMFLGEERIVKLSATDTFMLLMCSYAHDYGMAYDLEQIYSILEDTSGEFSKFLEEASKKNNETARNAQRIYDYYHSDNVNRDLKELYRCLIETLEEYLRPNHWQGVSGIENDFNVIFQGRLKKRFVKNIIGICQMHGRNVRDILTLDKFSNGLFTDLFHPRFIAAMIRLGDLLDLDNGRFSKEFEDAFFSSSNNIPSLSKIHYLKHESVTHFYVGPKRIEIRGECFGENAELIAQELSNWLEWIEGDCDFLIKEWDQIAQWDFGSPPRLKSKSVYVNGHEFLHNVYSLKMEMQQDKIFKLLAGSNVYENKYIAFREIIQNAIDASLFQLWIDLKNGKYDTYLSKSVLEKNYNEIQPKDISSKIWSNYPIHVNVYEDKKNEKVWVDVIDKGIGISEEDLVCMSKIGDGKTSNPNLMKLLNEMPNWMKPSGIFGIGLQSVFQLTNQIEFYTRKANKTPRKIVFHSYSNNKGSIYISKCHNGEYSTYFNQLSDQGTLVKLCIDKQMFQSDNTFRECDLVFDNMELNHAIYVELVRTISKLEILRNTNYFNIYFSDAVIEDDENNIIKPGRKQKIVVSEHLGKSAEYKNYIVDKNQYLSYNKPNLIFWDGKSDIMYKFKICMPKMEDETKKTYKLDYQKRILNIKYKFSPFKNIDSLYKNDIDKWNTYEDRLYMNENSLVSVEIDILDYPADKYLNIDRTNLKENSFEFSELLRSETTAFSEFCKMIINQSRNLSNEELVIFTILFYRFVEKNSFNQFYEKYKDDINSLNIIIGNTHIKLMDIYDMKKEEILLYDEIDGINKYDESSYNKEKLISVNEFSEIFPEHFLIPTKIEYLNLEGKSCKVYTCLLRNNYGKYQLELTEAIKKIEYSSLIIDSDGKYNTKKLTKALFKPDSKYKELIVDSAPTTFHKLDNYCNSLEYSIPNMILSPLDDEACKMLVKYLKSKVLSKEMNINKIIDHIMNSEHYNKCIEYISKNNSFDKSEITATYNKFIFDLLKLLCEFFEN